ncbi:hypothetical protein K0M31_004033 [Melipona bicolor]|uniref:Uncharacterized protein n=1 Tax=Melipona bicolor TaxID=60889 RepID=A0AA40KP21_9HYME|nr:hypothetical protein K0M31_004033 [Melipona bicolor]
MPDSLPLYRDIGSGSINFHAERKELRFRRRSCCHRSLVSSLSLFLSLCLVAASASITDELGRFSTEEEEEQEEEEEEEEDEENSEKQETEELERKIKKQIEGMSMRVVGRGGGGGGGGERREERFVRIYVATRTTDLDGFA